jgi:hypothetical protein
MATIGDGKSKSKNAKSEKINVKLNKSVINGIDKSENDKSEIKKIKNNDNSVTFIIVEKNGSLKDNEIQESLICAQELSKKCKFKKSDGFIKRTQWSCTSKNEKENVSNKITVELWAKDDGIANSENKYEFPPPVDTELFFGACALVARDSKNNYVNLTKHMWNKIYEYLFGGFESLAANDDDDDDEEDELESISKNKKTRDGYLKDGFVIDGGAAGDSDVDVAGNSDSDEDDDDDDDDSETDSDKSSENGGDGDGDGDGAGDGVYFKKNRNTVSKTVTTKMKIKSKHNAGDNEKYALKEEDDESGWKTDESSELSEEEYSYSK